MSTLHGPLVSLMWTVAYLLDVYPRCYEGSLKLVKDPREGSVLLTNSGLGFQFVIIKALR